MLKIKRNLIVWIIAISALPLYVQGQQALQEPSIRPSSSARVPVIHSVNPNALPEPVIKQIPADNSYEPIRSPSPIDNKSISINFNNVGIIEYIRFVSRLSNRNFIFDENELQFTVTIVSEEPTTIDNIMAALMQILRIHNLSIIDNGKGIIIHKNPKVGNLSQVVTDDLNSTAVKTAEMITKIFQLNTLEAERAAAILRPIMSDRAIIEPLKGSNTLVVTDLRANINEITVLLNSIDSPNSGIVIGQYVVKNSVIDNLIALSQEIMLPLAGSQTLNFIPQIGTNSIFIVSTPYLVERTIAILQYLDQTQGTTRIINPEQLRYGQGNLPAGAVGAGWELDPNGNWRFRPGAPGIGGGAPPKGKWVVDSQGNWYFQPGEEGNNEGPDGRWVKDANGNWVFQLNQGKTIAPIRVGRQAKIAADLPVGHIERTQFFIHKLRYRNGDHVARALSQVAQSLIMNGETNPELILAINSVQWIESSNSLVFTGIPEALDKIQDLVDEIDIPLRQVFLEMLILELDFTDTLEFSVNVQSSFGGGLVSGNQAFLSGASTLPAAINSAGVTVPTPPPNTSLIAQSNGFSLGVVGQHISHRGTLYSTLGALVNAVHTRSTIKTVMNPKILTEDNSPAEVFVGENTQFPTQSIANDLGSIVTQNYEFRDVGTRLRVTPLISNNDLITLDIQQEVSAVVSGATTSLNNLSNQTIGPTTSINRTTTKVIVPNKFFVVLSGNLQDTATRTRTQTPCLGSIPILGAAFSDKQVQDSKTNVMIFIRPEIIDTESQINDLTKRNQDMLRMKNRILSNWTLENEEALDFLNLEDTEDSGGEWECF